ncbi:MAG: AAA family ATPase, partial [Myxococcota bacterium]
MHGLILGCPAPAPSPRSIGAKISASGNADVLVGALYFESRAGTMRIKRIVESHGGDLVAVAGRRCVAVFRGDDDHTPVDRAVAGARQIIDQGMADRAAVDRDRVRVLRGRDGTPRLVATGFMHHERFPSASDPLGVLVTARTADSLAHDTADRGGDSSGLMRLVERTSDCRTTDPGDLIGRGDLVRELLGDARAAASDRRPGMVTVLASAGHGKSALGASLLAVLSGADPPFSLIELRARDAVVGGGQSLLRALFHAALDLPSSATAEQGQRAVLTHLGQESGLALWPAVASACGWLVGDNTAVARLRAAPAALRAARAQAAGEALRSLARARPVCCVLDDAHFADDTTLDALAYATLPEGGVPLWVCVLARPGFIDARPMWGNHSRHARIVEIGALDDTSAGELCRRLLRPARDVPAPTVARLVAQTRGSPLLLTELIRGIKQAGLIHRHGRGDGWYLATDRLDAILALPTAEWLAERALDALPEDLAAHARLLAVLGSAFSNQEIAGILRDLELKGLGAAFPLDSAVATRRLCGQDLLVTLGDDLFEFRHAVVRTQIARQLSAELRAQIHDTAYQYLRDTRSADDSRRLALMAYHAAQAGHDEVAADLYRDTAQSAQNQHDYVSAARLYGRVMELAPA